MGLKVRVDGSERNLSEYVIDADTGTLYNEGNGETVLSTSKVVL